MPHFFLFHFGPTEVIGTRCLRNREQLRKRKAETQEKQTSQWLFGEHKKRKRQRVGKGNESGRKRQQTPELKVDPQPQVGKETTEKILEPTEQKAEPLDTVTEDLHAGASEDKVVAEEYLAERCQETIINQEINSESQETGTQNYTPETCQYIAEPEVFSPEMCQETAVLQGHPSRMYEDVADPQVLSPEMCQETAVLQGHSSTMYQDMAELEVLSPKMCQETAVLQDYPSRMYQDVAEPEDLSPKRQTEK
ncbi:hemogen [Rhynchocyon petersi]